ncbi:MAG: histidine phosphatase family protein [Acidobacteriota bacterium]|jgi:broad specificity phosphatase PhoE|nr:histidine phosphatase family protein [Acidobacteriota bacterium]
MDRPRPRLILVRHGQPQQHSGRIFLGQTDVPLSERGREEAAAVGEELARRGIRVACVYASDLARARETAEIIAVRLGGVPVVPDAHFRELDMGAWDGELIEDVKRRHPDEYARRGEDLLNYRVPGGENFPDLRARVCEGFRRISRMAQEEPPTGREGGDALVIVSHLGVIHALLAELTDEDEAAIWRRRHPTGAVLALDATAFPAKVIFQTPP